MATYYVRQDGEAVNKEGATDPSIEAATSMNVSVFNGETFDAGDSVQFSDQGGTFLTEAIIPSSGEVGNPIVYTNVPGESPVFETPALSNTEPMSMNGKSNLTINGLDLRNLSDGSAAQCLRVLNANTNLTLTNLGIQAKTYGIVISGTSTGLVVDGITCGTRTATHVLWAYGAGNSNMSISNVNISGTGSIYIRNCTGLTMDGLDVTPAAGSGIKIEDCDGDIVINEIDFTGSDTDIVVETCSGNISLTNIESENRSIFIDACTPTNLILSDINILSSATSGIAINDTSPTNTGIIRRVFTRSGVGKGWRFYGSSSNIDVLDSGSISCAGDGVGMSDTAHHLTFDRFTCFGNGDKTTTTEGDGFTAHDTNHHITIQNSIVSFNTGTAFAMVGASHGTIINNLMEYNGGDWQPGGVDQIRGGVYINLTGANPAAPGANWTIRNNIFRGNYPRELFISLAGDAAVDFDHAVYTPIDDNAFASLQAAADISWDTYHASFEPRSVNAIAQLGSLGIPIKGGNCDVGRGDANARPGVGCLDRYRRPKLISNKDCIGDVYPQRESPENTLKPLIQYAEEIGSKA